MKMAGSYPCISPPIPDGRDLKQVRHGVFTSVPHLEKCLREYLHSYNETHALWCGQRLSTKSSTKFIGVVSP